MQEIVRSDAVPTRAPLDRENTVFLGSEDIPFERYTSREFFALEMKCVWEKTWQWACREEHVREPGDYLVYEIGRHSVIVVRTQSGLIKAYVNSCLHRGTKLKESGSDGSSPELRCPYHGWTWTLDGKLDTFRCRWDFPHVDPEKYSLPEVRVESWGGFVFVNLDPNAAPLREQLGVLPEHFANFPLEDRYVELHVQKELPCNWKAAQEAFIENYHTAETHPQLLRSVATLNTQYDIFGDHVARFYAVTGVCSGEFGSELSEQEILDDMLVGDRSLIKEKPTLAPGQTARNYMASYLRKAIGEGYKTDLSGYTDSEVIDTIEYNLFPNMFLFPGLSLPMVYRFRPLGNDPDRALFELLFLRPSPKGAAPPPPATPVRLSAEDSWARVPGFDPAFAYVYDQDTGNLRNQQMGFYAARKQGATLANRQEVRVRHLNQTIDKYIAKHRGEA